MSPTPTTAKPVDLEGAASERAAAGKAAREKAPRSSHGEWKPAKGRKDPVKLLEDQAKRRVPELVPIRYGRMVASAFIFLRGAAAIMAMDLAKTPQSGLRVQACGDAHLSNFGVFATPDRRLVWTSMTSTRLARASAGWGAGLARELGQHSGVLREAVGPHAERLARELLRAPDHPTPLTKR